MMSLAVVALLGATVPAGAHTASPGAVPVAVAGGTSVGAEMLRTSAPESPLAASALIDRSPLLLVAIMLGAIGIRLGIDGARRHPRRALLLLLALLLAGFTFEDGLHSVHHGFDAKQYGECPIAAASAHLSAVSVDGVLAMAVTLMPTGAAAVSDPASPPARLLEPHPGRAPPLAAA